jgi:hypothetical protein
MPILLRQCRTRNPQAEALMVRKWIPALTVAMAVAACGGDRGGSGVVERDTILTTEPDTLMIERTVTEDTIRNPDLDRDTLERRDTLP